MDLLFKRYASPFLFMGEMMNSGRFDEFVIEFTNTINQETDEKSKWEFYLHKVEGCTFADFIEDIETDEQNRTMSEAELESITEKSFAILDNFNPLEGGE